MERDTLEALVAPIVEKLLEERIATEVRAQVSRYNLESLARMVSWAMHHHNTGQKTTIDVEKTLKQFLDITG